MSNNKHKEVKKLLPPIFFASASLFLLSSFLFPIIKTSAASDSKDIDVDVTLQNAISLSVPSTIGWHFKPECVSSNCAGSESAYSYAIHSTTINATVSTNNSYGYTLTMTSSSASTGLTSASYATPFATLASDTTAANFPLNRFGYSLDSGANYKPLQASGSTTDTTIRTVTSLPTTSADKTTAVTFGAKADYSYPTGDYSNTLVFTATTNTPPPPFGGITTMQQMTPAICATEATPSASSTTVPTAQLTDTRDNKTYWVSKLADGNCWMTQNLDFVISTSGTALSTADSDVSFNKTLTAINDWNSENVSFYEGGNNYLPNGTGSATGVSGLSADNPNWHYHVGNFYNWVAATAGSGTRDITNADATESICPKGWRLPAGNSYADNYSFGKLTNIYGITDDSIGSSDIALLSLPLWFVRAGSIYGGGLVVQGESGEIWSIRAGSYSEEAYSLYFRSDYVAPLSGMMRFLGNSVRCVASGEAVNPSPSPSPSPAPTQATSAPTSSASTSGSTSGTSGDATSGYQSPLGRSLRRTSVDDSTLTAAPVYDGTERTDVELKMIFDTEAAHAAQEKATADATKMDSILSAMTASERRTYEDNYIESILAQEEELWKDL